MNANVAPSLHHRQNHGCKLRSSFEKISKVPLERSSLVGKCDQAERLQDPTDLIRELGRDVDEACTGRDQRSGKHAAEPLHAHLAEKADFCQMSQTIGIIGVRLVWCHVHTYLDRV